MVNSTRNRINRSLCSKVDKIPKKSKKNFSSGEILWRSTESAEFQIFTLKCVKNKIQKARNKKKVN